MSGPLQIRPIDAVTLADLPGYRPVNFGRRYVEALSPDRSTLAAITWPSSEVNARGALRLVDLSSWSDHATDVTVDTAVAQLFFSPDGRMVYWIRATALAEGGEGMPFRLYRYEIGSSRLTTVVSFASSFQPVLWQSRLTEVRLLGSGHRLVVYGTAANSPPRGAPRVVMVDLDRNQIAYDVAIKGVTDGQVRVGAGSPDLDYVAGRAWDISHERLYVVDPVRDTVAVFDLANGAVLKQGRIHQRASLLDRIWQALVLPAEAKEIGPGTQLRAAVTGDGATLFLTGTRREVDKKADGSLNIRETPLGLRVIATRDLTELRRLDLPVGDVQASPDGKRVLLTGAHYEEIAGRSGTSVGSGLYLVDAARFDVLAHLQAGAVIYLDSFSRDGRYAYVYRFERGAVYQVVDLSTISPGAERALPGYIDGPLSAVAVCLHDSAGA